MEIWKTELSENIWANIRKLQKIYPIKDACPNPTSLQADIFAYSNRLY